MAPFGSKEEQDVDKGRMTRRDLITKIVVPLASSVIVAGGGYGVFVAKQEQDSRKVQSAVPDSSGLPSSALASATPSLAPSPSKARITSPRGGDVIDRCFDVEITFLESMPKFDYWLIARHSAGEHLLLRKVSGPIWKARVWLGGRSSNQDGDYDLLVVRTEGYTTSEFRVDLETAEAGRTVRLGDKLPEGVREDDRISIKRVATGKC